MKKKVVGQRSTFVDILKEYHGATNPVTKAVYRDILRNRLLASIDRIDSKSFGKYVDTLRDI